MIRIQAAPLPHINPEGCYTDAFADKPNNFCSGVVRE